MERAVAAVGLEKREFGKGWAKAEWKLPEKGHLVRSKNAAGWGSSVFLRFAHLYLCPCLSIFASINAERNKWSPSGHQVVTKWSPSGQQVVGK